MNRGCSALRKIPGQVWSPSGFQRLALGPLISNLERGNRAAAVPSYGSGLFRP